MRRALKSLSVLLAIFLMAGLTSCSSGGTRNPAKPNPGTLSTPKVTSSTEATTTVTPATTTSLALILDAPHYQKYCSTDYPYCVEFPTVNGITEDDHRSYKAGEITKEPLDAISFTFGVELATGRVCTKWYEDGHKECDGFDDMYYSVDARPMPNVRPEDALAEWLQRSKQSMHALNYTTFAGSPAVTGQFGQLGTYTAFFHKGVLYEIATNGQAGRPYGEQRFLDSFQFTN